MSIVVGVTILVIVGVLLYCILSFGGTTPLDPSFTASERETKALAAKYVPSCHTGTARIETKKEPDEQQGG